MELKEIKDNFAVCAEDYFNIRNGLPNARRLFKQTGKGRVAFLGGSITAAKGWRNLICAELKSRFPKTRFDFINAGIPSTGSTPGAFRLVRDVFKNGPVDLLFEEAAVNDFANGRSTTEQIRAMEGIVRHARKFNPTIDIILLYFVDPDKMKTYKEGKVPKVIRNHEKVSAHYQLSSINLALEVTERIHRGEFTWNDDFKGLHPAPFGHRLYCNTIKRLFDAAWSAKADTGDHARVYRQPKKLDKFSYDNGMLTPPDKAKNLKGFTLNPRWKNTVGGMTRPGFVNIPMLVGETPGNSFELSFIGSAVGLFIAAGPDAGFIEHRIDNGKWKKQDLYTKWSKDLHIPWLHILEAELNVSIKHRLEVRVSNEKNRASKGYSCRIVNFAINGKALP